FGKTEQGNIWLDANYTSPYAFYQFWLNVSDQDAQKYIKIFTMLSKEIIDSEIAKHLEAPHKRELQRLLAKEVTTMVHGKEEYGKALKASSILFGQSTSETLKELDEKTFLNLFEGVPQFDISRKNLRENIIELLAVHTSVFPSKGECRKMIQAGGVSVNKNKIDSIELALSENDLLNQKYILVQKGKKNYFILKII
ncbi:MAG: tyrosine--tRNA ligase, partial [Bacteroidales bacterium]